MSNSTWLFLVSVLGLSYLYILNKIKILDRNNIENMQVSPAPYKGTRDFYPRNSLANVSKGNFIKEEQEFLLETIKKTLIKFGYNQYSSSVIEDKAPFVVKSGGDLGGKQLYEFLDKGEREICLRPELTLSAARMISNKFSDLRFPLRWFSVDNCFRYERPQKGRTREFWQVEVNIIGLEAGAVDLEILITVYAIFKAFKAKKQDYVVYYNHRVALDKWVEKNNWQDKKTELFKIMDDWFKIDLETKTNLLMELFNDEDQVNKVLEVANKNGKGWEEYLEIVESFEEMKLINKVLFESGAYDDFSIILHPCIIRGQAYYTGIVLEVFDVDKDNNRSLFGGGRFDNLLDIYGKKSPAIGFAPGDLPLHEFLKAHNLYPDFEKMEKTKKALIPKDEDELMDIFEKQLPGLIDSDESFEIDYELDRSLNKRQENMRKRGAF